MDTTHPTTPTTPTTTPDSPAINSARLEVRLPPPLLATLQAAAAADDRDLSSWVRTRLERAARAELDRETRRGQD